MPQDEVMANLQELMKAHGVELTHHEGWLFSGDGLPAIRGTWFQQIGNQQTGRLDIQVVLDNDKVIDECFAGVGDDRERYLDALQNFSLGSLHVLLSALWARPFKDQVLIESWQSAKGNWKAYVGEFVSRCLGPDEIMFPRDLLDIIQNALMKADLDPGVHWLRTFYSNTGNGDPVLEVLLDNEKWEAGMQAVSGASWQPSDYYYSLRNFLILEHRA
ncbi:MAG: hypothetical protein GY789_22825 [Hyphomicrobiales bacterium]|nr:hypothetical protein [Hyphomicrobiales bacterium]MCP5000382.1 hypothetical protein [Hyphomicrobiales bacterium]